MNKMMLASLTLLLAGATALPVTAAENKRGPGGQQSWQADHRQGDRSRHREDRRDDRQDHRRGRRDDRQDWRADHRDQRQDNRHDRYDNRYDRRYDRRDDRRDYRQDYRQDYRRDHARYVRHHDHRWKGNYWYPQYRYRAPVRYVYPPGYRSYHWRVGHRLPPSYYHRHYYVDYRPYRLPPPPYGYHWVRVDRDVVLVALATGVILDAIYGIYY